MVAVALSISFINCLSKQIVHARLPALSAFAECLQNVGIKTNAQHFFCGFHNLRFTKWQGCIFESCSAVRTGQSLVSILSSGIELASHLAINSSKSFIINFPFLRSRSACSNNSYVAESIRINHIQNHTFVCCADYDIPVLAEFILYYKICQGKISPLENSPQLFTIHWQLFIAKPRFAITSFPRTARAPSPSRFSSRRACFPQAQGARARAALFPRRESGSFGRTC